MKTIVEEIRNGYLGNIEMLRLAILKCPDAYWKKEFGDNSPFWKETFHCIFWIRNFVGNASKHFEFVPFERDIDPRLFEKPTTDCSKDEMLDFLEKTISHINNSFENMVDEDLISDDDFGPEDEFRNVMHRLIYGLRHGQHHVGKLTGYLFSNKIDYDPWA